MSGTTKEYNNLITCFQDIIDTKNIDVIIDWINVMGDKLITTISIKQLGKYKYPLLLDIIKLIIKTNDIIFEPIVTHIFNNKSYRDVLITRFLNSLFYASENTKLLIIVLKRIQIY